MGTAVAFAGETPPKMVTRLGIEPRTYGLRVVKHVFCRGVKWSFGGHFEAEVGVGVSWEVWRGVEWYLIWLANCWGFILVERGRVCQPKAGLVAGRCGG